MVTTSNKLKDTLTSDLVTVTLLLLIDKPLHSLQWHIITTSAWVLAEVMFSLPFVCLLGEYWDHKNWLNFGSDLANVLNIVSLVPAQLLAFTQMGALCVSVATKIQQSVQYQPNSFTYTHLLSPVMTLCQYQCGTMQVRTVPNAI